MALKFEIDAEAFEALNESQQGLYSKHGENYRLQVEGIDPADELKEALRKEREERAEAKRKLQEFESQQQESERKALEEREEYEKLYKQEMEKSTRTSQEFENLKREIAENKRNETALSIAGKLTKDTKRLRHLKRDALEFIHHTPEGVKINGPDGEAWDATKLVAYLAEQNPFLCDGNQSSGGGATGGASGGAVNGKKFAEMSGAELSALRQTDAAAYERLKSEHYGH